MIIFELMKEYVLLRQSYITHNLYLHELISCEYSFKNLRGNGVKSLILIRTFFTFFLSTKKQRGERKKIMKRKNDETRKQENEFTCNYEVLLSYLYCELL